MQQKWEEIQKKFQDYDIATVTFKKKDGTPRTMVCTRSIDLLPLEQRPKTEPKINYEVMNVFEILSQGPDGTVTGQWRSFRIDSIIDGPDPV